MRKAMIFLFAGVLTALVVSGAWIEKRSQATSEVMLPTLELQPTGDYPTGLYQRSDAEISPSLPAMTFEIKRVDGDPENPALSTYEISIYEKDNPDTLIQRFQCESDKELSASFLLLEDISGDGFLDLAIENGNGYLQYIWDEDTSSFTQA